MAGGWHGIFDTNVPSETLKGFVLVNVTTNCGRYAKDMIARCVISIRLLSNSTSIW